MKNKTKNKVRALILILLSCAAISAQQSKNQKSRMRASKRNFKNSKIL
jgi:hypothetical protein